MYYIDHSSVLIKFKLFTPYIILLTLEIVFENFAVECATKAEIDNHLRLGTQFLSKGQLSDALTHYHAAVEGDPNNYLTYFKRGTVYLALGKARLALADLDRTIHLKPDFLTARMSRGTVYLKLCDLDRAQVDFHNVLMSDPTNIEAENYLNTIESVRHLKLEVKANYAVNNYDQVIMYLTSLLEFCPWSSKYRKFRADVHKETGNYQLAVSDLRSTTRLESDNTDGYLELSRLLYKLGDATSALKEIRECLRLDPEHSECFPFYKKIKKVEKYLSEAESDKQRGNYEDCIESAERALKLERDEEMVKFLGKQILCTCYMKNDQTAQAIKVCREALEISKEPSTYCDRAEAYIQSEMYEDAIRDYQAAIELDENHQRAKEGLQKVQKLQAQAERRDYYKILGVKRSATKKDIIKAYRKAAQKWHPDNFQQKSDEEKKLAEKKFIDIAAAKEVLTDEEKRAQFDNGEDPLDPESGAHRQAGANPFHHFHQGSPFHFRFHFN